MIQENFMHHTYVVNKCSGCLPFLILRMKWVGATEHVIIVKDSTLCKNRKQTNALEGI